ncbi:hypothetical protein L3Q82_015282 [Scortum barcoo]|uniref:Uncharacterized protein n=1 Tax=Scortum barcoo TaxID=214431 RepID=A0ACB8VTQ2_9TELE|nr:hypothetical protein L3Q82_015282 [Scortum barcoo]
MNLVCSAVKHSLRFFFTVSSGIPIFPEVVAVALINDVQAGYCDSKIKTALPKQDWMENLRDGDPEYWRCYTHECTVYQQVYKEEFDILKRHLNQTGSMILFFLNYRFMPNPGASLAGGRLVAGPGRAQPEMAMWARLPVGSPPAGRSMRGLHILQLMHGCEWDDETGEVHAYKQFGYDGEDFLTFDVKTETLIAEKPQAVTTKHFWDRQRARKVLWKDFLIHICPEWLKKHLNYGKSSLLRTDLPLSVSPPEVSLLSSQLPRYTGFYPDRATLIWRKDGEELHEDVDHGEILPNHDGSFQMSVDLKLSSVTPEDWSRYDCVFHLSGVKDDIVTKLDKAEIRTNWGETGILTLQRSCRSDRNKLQAVNIQEMLTQVVIIKCGSLTFGFLLFVLSNIVSQRCSS